MAEETHDDMQTQDEAKPTKPTGKGVEFLDFWATWCGPCTLMAPVIKELEEEFAEKVTFIELDVDDESNSELMQEYQVMSVPTYIIRKDGEVVDHFIGVQAKDLVAKKLTTALEKETAK